MKIQKLGVTLLASTILMGLSVPTAQAATNQTTQQATTSNESSTETSESANDANTTYTTEGQNGPTTQNGPYSTT